MSGQFVVTLDVETPKSPGIFARSPVGAISVSDPQTKQEVLCYCYDLAGKTVMPAFAKHVEVLTEIACRAKDER